MFYSFIVPGIRIVENVNLWEVISDYSATKRYAVFLTNEDGDVQEGQLPFFNVFLLLPILS